MAGSNTFGGTIKLEGEKAYREALKQINSNLRVLASEMVEVIVVNHSDNEMLDIASTRTTMKIFHSLVHFFHRQLKGVFALNHEKSAFYPMKMVPHFKDYLWGGQNLRKFNKLSSSQTMAETWELSTNENELSFVGSGQYKGFSLRDVIKVDPQAVLGGNLVKDLPIIVKLIDAAKDLSIQVHPSTEDESLMPGISGKSELWYVVDCKPGAFVYCGFNRDTTWNEVKTRAQNGTICEILNKVAVAKGNSLFVPAKTIHALGSGIVVAEVQQNSDTTFRVFDYNRVDKDGNLRQLHLDKAIKILNFEKTNIEDLIQRELTRFKCDFFEVTNVKVLDEMSIHSDKKRFQALLFLSGSGNIIYNEEKFGFSIGDCYFIPAEIERYKVKGCCQFLLVEV